MWPAERQASWVTSLEYMYGVRGILGMHSIAVTASTSLKERVTDLVE